MKKITIILMAGIVGLLSACDSWLDVKPYDSMTEDQLYSTEQGIQKALNGLYLGLASENLYAKEMTCGTVDVLSQRFYIKSTENPYHDMVNFRYTNDDPKAIFEKIWKEAYRLIADCNNFLERVPEYKALLTKRDNPVMMGEALAVRTYLHFDMFRLFVPVYTVENLLQHSIPYYSRVTDVPASLLTAESMMKNLIADIDTAIVWMAKDPVRTDGLGDKDGFWDYRNLRMNYYAAWALKARMLWYMGSGYESEAHQIVADLLEGKDPGTTNANNFTDIFPPVSGKNVAKDRIFFPEILFGIHNMKRDDLYKKLFSTDLDDKSILWVTQSYFSGMYTQENDYRNRWFENATADRGEVKMFLKFRPEDAAKGNTYGHETQALIRLSELLLIAASTTDDPEEKTEYLEQLRINRGYQTGNADGFDPEVLLDEEYQREFYGEGQYFFFLKRNQVKTIKNQEGNNVGIGEHYIIPMPDSEINNRYN